MPNYKSAIGDIPEDWFENDVGPDPKYKKMTPTDFDDELDAMIAENAEKAKKAKRPLGHSSDHPPEPLPRSEK